MVYFYVGVAGGHLTFIKIYPSSVFPWLRVYIGPKPAKLVTVTPFNVKYCGTSTGVVPVFNYFKVVVCTGTKLLTVIMKKLFLCDSFAFTYRLKFQLRN